MSFQSKSIKSTINSILDGDYVLPAIQRHFVWDHDRITNLFDSIMRGYPIGSFLFWRVKAASLKDYQYYDFIKDFHVNDNKYNKKLTPSGNKELTAILDGQQRLTSLLIGLKGSYTYKTRYLSKNNPKAYLKRKLFLNLLETKDDGGYEFSFLTEEESKKDDSKFWYCVSRILTEDTSNVLLSDEIANLSKEKRSMAYSILMKLNKYIDAENINFYLEDEQDIDKVLNIFIRVNSGGITLSHSDLLLSTATALWDKYDAREEIERLIQTFANCGNGLKITSDFIMKSCLTLTDIDVKFLIKNFNKANMTRIENDWDAIKDSLLSTMYFVIGCGYSQDNLHSYNTLLPIAYYIKKHNLAGKFESHDTLSGSRKAASSWLRRALLKKAFGGNSDTVISSYRDIINKSTTADFPIDEINTKFKNEITFTNEDINDIFDETGYGKDAFYILSEIFDTQYNTSVHMDHLYPYSSFSSKNLKKWGFKSTEQQNEVLWWANSLANLQLLNYSSNICKSDTPFQEWVTSLSSEERRLAYIPNMDNYNPEFFIDFCGARIELMKSALKNKLGIV